MIKDIVLKAVKSVNKELKNKDLKVVSEETKNATSQDLTKAQIKEKYNFDIDAQLIDGEVIGDDHVIQVSQGGDFDLH